MLNTRSMSNEDHNWPSREEMEIACQEREERLSAFRRLSRKKAALNRKIDTIKMELKCYYSIPKLARLAIYEAELQALSA